MKAMVCADEASTRSWWSGLLDVLGHATMVANGINPVNETIVPDFAVIESRAWNRERDIAYLFDMGVKAIFLTPPRICQELTDKRIFLYYPYHFDNGFKKLKELLFMVGDMHYAYIENTKKNADNALDENIDSINISRYLFGEPERIVSKDIRKLLAFFSWNTKECTVLHNFNCLNTLNRTRVEVVGEKGNLIYNYGAHHIYFASADKTERIAIPYDCQNPDFEGLKYFLDKVEVEDFNSFEEWEKDIEIVGKLLK